MSLTNSKAAADVQRLLREVRVRIEATAKEVRDVTAAVMALRLRRAELFKDLAKLRLEALAGENVGRDLERAERQAMEILQRRDEALAALDQKITEATARVESLAGDEAATIGRIEALGTAIDNLEERVEAELGEDAAYQAQAQKTHEAEAVATRAERKAEQAAKDRIEKGKPYEADPFFMYLWQRKYGTKDYWDWPAFRYFDGKVARLCDFDVARAGYAALLGLPERLSEHAKRLRTQAAGQADRLEELEQLALAAAGHKTLTDKLAGDVAQAKQLDTKLTHADSVLVVLRKRQATFLSGADGGYKQAVKFLATDLETDDLRTLYDEARSTPMPEDDQIVAGLDEVMAELDDREADLAEGRALLQAQSQHLSELEGLAGVWRERTLAEVAGPTLGDVALTGLKIAGLVSLGLPLAVLALAAAGGGGEGSSSRSGSPRRRRSSSSRRSSGSSSSSSSSSSGSFGGGGFKTGGRVGGGGFKTGGSF
jgi:hypothetical protein